MFRALVILFGLLEFLFPKRIVDFWTRLAFDGDDRVEARPWVITAARLEGLVFVLYALVSALKHRSKAAAKKSKSAKVA
ncbi:hypothetical protein [Haloarchaeobius sp. TZWWS8]|uniref:hypothetical protein n=1 Tax=Haloarchaeobius sp. TZWWS8 TaxID=3446121 RepID=UPI003EC0E393